MMAYASEQTYENFDELLNVACDKDIPIWDETCDKHAHISSISDNGHSWCYNATLEDAIKMGRLGWVEGRKNMSENLELAHKSTNWERLPDYEYDVAGYIPNIPLYVSGSPAHMMLPSGKENAPRKTIEIVMHVGARSGIRADTIVYRGASILSLVDKLEDQGISCHLTGCYYAEGDTGYGKRLVEFTIKRAGQPMDIDRCAFIMTHPAMQRRILFRLLEQDPKAYKDFSRAYGRSVDVPLHMRTGKIYFPYINNMKAQSIEHGVSMAVNMYERQINGKDWDGRSV